MGCQQGKQSKYMYRVNSKYMFDEDVQTNHKSSFE